MDSVQRLLDREDHRTMAEKEAEQDVYMASWEDLERLYQYSEMGKDRRSEVPGKERAMLDIMDKVWSEELDLSYQLDVNPFSCLLERVLKEKASELGYCYLGSLIVLQGFRLAHPLASYKMVQDARNTLKELPKGAVVFNWLAGSRLYGANPDLDHLPHGGWSPHCSIGSECLGEMIESKVRFRFTEMAQSFHLEIGSFNPCDCSDELYCRHGFSAKYVLTIMCDLQKSVGSTLPTVDFNSFFADGDNETQSNVFGLQPTESRFEVTQHSRKSHELHVPPLSPSAFKPSVQKDKVASGDDTVIEGLRSELRPDDSSSNLGRYKREYLHPGSVLASRRGGRGGATQEDLVKYDLPAIPEVVVGFVKTAEVARKEIFNYHQVMPINGLARPFRNQRLNLLCHMHTAIVRLSGSERPKDLITHLKALSERKSLTPTTELLNQIVKLTFDWDDMEVAANPFRLPYIEPHMAISDDSLSKCVDLLWSEYRSLWFEEMKSLEVPSFSSDYHSKSDSLFSGLGSQGYYDSPGTVFGEAAAGDNPQPRSRRRSTSRKSRSITSGLRG